MVNLVANPMAKAMVKPMAQTTAITIRGGMARQHAAKR
jgi:hypothetical protein